MITLKTSHVLRTLAIFQEQMKMETVRFQAVLYGTYYTGIWVSPIQICNSNLRLPNIMTRLYVKEKKLFMFVLRGGGGVEEIQ